MTDSPTDHPQHATPRRKPWRRLIGLAVLIATGASLLLFLKSSFAFVAPGQAGVLANRWSGSLTLQPEGPCLQLPLLHELRTFPTGSLTYTDQRGTRSDGEAPYNSFEGLPIGLEVSVRYAIPREQLVTIATRFPGGATHQLVAPLVSGVLHRTVAKHTAREIFSTLRVEIQASIEEELETLFAAEGLALQSVIIGNIDLPARYSKDLEALLAEQLEAERMVFVLERKKHEVEQHSLEAQAAKVQAETAAEAQANREVIAAKGRAEAMKHVLPFKQKEVEQRRLEAEAQGTQRIQLAEADATARRVEAAAEADARRTLAEAEAFRVEVTGKASAEQLARESVLIAENPLLIQKALVDQLSDNIQVIVAPPPEQGFFAANLLNTGASTGGKR